MKIWITTLCAVLLASQASAVMLNEGTKELGIAGNYDFQSVDGSQVDIEIAAGYFLAYGLESGFKFKFQDSDSASLVAGLAFLEYNFYTETVVVPFVGGGLGLASAEVKDAADETAMVLEAIGGIKVFLAENVALSGQFNLDFASEDIFVDDDDAESVNVALVFGLRFFFP